MTYKQGDIIEYKILTERRSENVSAEEDHRFQVRVRFESSKEAGCSANGLLGPGLDVVHVIKVEYGEHLLLVQISRGCGRHVDPNRQVC